MISHPGDILARFGRYEAIEDLGVKGQGHFWRAWDPYLERYVLIATLPDLDPAELHRHVSALPQVLPTWLGEEGHSIVFDFGPGGYGDPAFFVLPWEVEEADGPHATVPPLTEPVGDSLWQYWPVVAAVAALALGLIVYRLRG